MNAIEVEKLSRTFNGLKAVDNISFSVEAGEIFGFPGHNGEGSDACCLHRADRGAIRIQRCALFPLII
jgi:ABC-type uncharacterized transport system ATPase subunit